MTIQEFSDIKFSSGMRIRHTLTDKIYEIVSVDFEEMLIGVSADEYYNCRTETDEIKWLRCEHCELTHR